MKENKMGTMPIGRLIINMSWPAMISMMIQAFYNIVDSYFVSMIGEQALAAVTYIFPLQMVQISFSVGTGIGINSLIARRLGAKRIEDANKAASHGYRLGIYTWIPFCFTGLFLANPIMRIMTDTPYIRESGSAYLRIIMVCSLFIIVQVVSEKILQATGNMIFPMLCSISGAVVNIALDPILIFGIGPFPEMGVTGAAIATVIGQIFSFTIGQCLLFGKKHPVKVKLTGFKWEWHIIKEIYAVGAPAILMQSIGSVMQFGMNLILGSFTDTAVAVMGVYGRLQSFIFMPVFGLNQGVLPIMGFNYGAQNRRRFIETYKKGMLMAMIIMCCGMAVFQLFPEQIIAVFNSNNSADMFEIGVPAFRILSLVFPPAAFGIMTSSIFQGSGHGFISMWGSIIRQLVGILPMAYLFSVLFDLQMVWWSIPLAEILGTLYFALIFRYFYKKEFSKLGQNK